MRPEEAIEKGIDLESLKKEQRKLSKSVSQKDTLNEPIQKIAGIIAETTGKDILAVVVLLDEQFNVIEKHYSLQRPKLPYIPGFRAFRELPAILDAYGKLENEPDVIFVLGHGIAHPNGLGIASHLGISIQKPVIGVAKSIVFGKEKENKVYNGKKIISEKLKTKECSNPVYVSIGNQICLKSAIELTKRFTREPHKMPEPIVEARKFAKEVKEEII